MEEYYKELGRKIEADPKLKECIEYIRKSMKIYNSLSEDDQTILDQYFDVLEEEPKDEEV